MRPARVALAVTLLASPLAVPAGTLLLPPGGGSADAGEVAEVLEDAGGRLGPEEVSRPPAAGRFAPLRAGALRSGLPSVFWVRFAVENGAPEHREWWLSYGFPLVERLDLYERAGGGFTIRAGGLAVPEGARGVLHAGGSHDAALELGPGERRELLLRVATRASLLVPPRLHSPEALERRHRIEAVALGAGLGLLLLLGSLFAYAAASLRLAQSGTGAAFVLSFAAVLLALSGYGPLLLWPDASGFWLRAVPVAGGVTLALGLLFSRRFLQLAERDPLLERALAAFTWLAAAAAATSALARGPGAVLLGAVLATSFATGLVAAVRAARRRDHGARPFLAAALLLLASGVAFGLTVAGLLPPSLLSIHGLAGGFVVAATVLALALGDRAVLGSRTARRYLEEQVASRTRALDEAVSRLRAEAGDRRQVLAALRDSEERFRVAFETSPDAISITRVEDGTYLAVNQGFADLSGWSREDVLGRSSLEIDIWADPADRARLVGELSRAGTARNLEFRFRLKDRSLLTGVMSAQIIQLQGQPYILSVTRDMSEWKRAEADRARLQDELRQAQKLEAIGRLAGGVAHDFNNLLTVIATNANLSLLEIPESHPCRPSFVEIQDAARRATALTRQLLAFGRRQVIELKPLDLSAHVAGMQGMLRRLLNENVEISFDLDAALSPVMADRGQVEQVLVNLAVNARDALPAGGRITVTTRARGVEAARAGDDRPAGRYGVLSVADTGSGMPPEVRAHVFEPFFTTKQRGTGLGLATVYGIARQHSGFVDVESEVGRGSAFHVFFPLAPAAALAAEAPAAPQVPLPRGAETLLLVEDEDAVRNATRLLLERLGYRVLPARDGIEALAVAAGLTGPLHLLVTDVVMPRMSGPELARAMAARRPGLPVLFVSGYSREVVTGSGLLEPGLRLLQKPFEPGELARAVRELLDGPAGTLGPTPSAEPAPPASSA